MTEAEALRRLKEMTDWSKIPALKLEEIERVLRRNARASVWKLSTAYVYGDKIIPVVRNGHYYKVSVAGTSAATEPTYWPTDTDGSVINGTVTLVEAGADFTDLWDLQAAAHECWNLKAGKAARRFAYSAEGGRYERDQVYQHCLEMAARYEPVYIA